MNEYDKARAFGLDEATIELAGRPFTIVTDQHHAIQNAHERVIMNAAAYDHPGYNVRLDWLGRGISVPDAKGSITLFGDGTVKTECAHTSWVPSPEGMRCRDCGIRIDEMHR